MIWLTTSGQERPSALSCPHLAAAGEAVSAHLLDFWRPREAVMGTYLALLSGGCWRSRRGHSALCLAASGGRQRSSFRHLAAVGEAVVGT